MWPAFVLFLGEMIISIKLTLILLREENKQVCLRKHLRFWVGFAGTILIYDVICAILVLLDLNSCHKVVSKSDPNDKSIKHDTTICDKIYSQKMLLVTMKFFFFWFLKLVLLFQVLKYLRKSTKVRFSRETHTLVIFLGNVYLAINFQN